MFNCNVNFQISTNGYFSFGQRTLLKKPFLFNTSSSVEYIVAPYWSDTSTREAGSVTYEIHTNATSSSSLSLLNKVSKFIRHREQNQFSGAWMLVVEWNRMPKPGNM